ncbi:hypothetical protein SEPCBS119000_005378 [Sporothrix epigloea]|uniref:C2H2-type zinc finger ascomycetes domain-containing protein n=1 Tax=Sporothrix epigloea TaxID=1892477 RepID=A0ABP0E1A6_9PEZI
MAIPNLSQDYRAPPPLPPPRVVPVDGPMSAAANEYQRREQVYYDESSNQRPRSDRDEAYHSVEPASQDSAPSSRFAMHRDNYLFKSSADAYDNSLLKKLDMRRTLDSRTPLCRSHPGASDRDTFSPTQRFPQIQPLSLPTRMKLPHSQSLFDPNHCSDRPMYSSVSPRSAPLTYYGIDQRSPRGETPSYYRPPSGWTYPANSSSTANDTGALDTANDYTGFTVEDTRSRDFHCDWPTSQVPGGSDHHTAGKKRPATSPPGDDEEPMPVYNMSSSDHLRWRESVTRGSPTPRLSTNMQDSVSSISSSTRRNSYSSNLSAAATSVTSTALSTSGAQGGRLPAGDCFSPTDTTGTTPTSTCASPFAASMMQTASPQSAVVSRPVHHRIRETSQVVSPPTRRLPHAKSGLKRSDFFMCECCPKKPKKFESEDQLRYDRAFHESTFQPGKADTCGYCGKEFPRNGLATGRLNARQPTEQDWDDRIRHLQDDHKFRECNAGKKFFRADHFRQHLKHSHAGTSGKWTNLLENACMTEE